MSQTPKDTRFAAEKARDTAGIIGSFIHEGYVPILEDEAIHQRPSGAKSRPRRPLRFFANAPLSGSERRSSASVCNPARRMIIGDSPSLPRSLGACIVTQGCVIPDSGWNCD